MKNKIILDKQKIIDYHNSGLSIKKISLLMNVSITPVRKILKDNHIDTSCTSEQYSRNNRIYLIDDTYFQTIDTANKAYILGLLYADGNLHNKKCVVSLELKEEDKDILYEIRDEVKSNKPLFLHKKYKQNYQNNYRLDLTNYLIYNDLKRHGLFPNKSLTLKFPPNIKINLLPHFIRGYFDGDGCIYYKLNENNYISKEFSILGTENFCQGIKYVFDKIGITTGRIDKPKKIYRLRYGTSKDLKLIYNFLYSHENKILCLSRKFEKFSKLIDIL